MIGLILLIGIVMKNAIMMIDVAVEARRSEHLSSYDGDIPRVYATFPPNFDDHRSRNFWRSAIGHALRQRR